VRLGVGAWRAVGKTPVEKTGADPGVWTKVRRAFTVPIVVGFEILLLLLSPLLLAVGALVTLGARSTRPVRTVALVLAYAAIELSTLRRILRDDEPDWNQLLRDVVGMAYTALRRVLDVRVELEDGSATPARLATGNPVIVLARHCGPGDSLFIAWLLVVHYGLRLSIVLKSALRAEPMLDLAGDHLPLCFIAHSGKRARDQVEEFAASLSAGDALLLFPEGGNFSWPRWRRAVSSLVASGAFRAARRAQSRTHTLPPRRGGAVAALSGSPHADVLLLAHNGFTADGRDRPWWRLPVHRPMMVRTTFVPAASVPRDSDALTTWLDTAWARVDSWVESHSVPVDLALSDITPVQEP
jgi:1-acyl-sn-glycerol-3-phosphate acyltransferase